MSFKAMPSNEQNQQLESRHAESGKTADMSDPTRPSVSQFFIFQGENYLGWDCFYKEKIILGSSSDADLVLDDETIEPIQAIVHVKGDRVTVSDQTSAAGVTVNGKPARTAVLGPFDVVDVGQFSLKVKLRKGENQLPDMASSSPSIYTGTAPVISQTAGREESGSSTHPEKIQSDTPVMNEAAVVLNEAAPTPEANDPSRETSAPVPETNAYQIIFDGKIAQGNSIPEVQKKLAELLKKTGEQIDSLFSQGQTIIKKGVDYQTAINIMNRLESFGAVARVELMKHEETGAPFGEDQAPDPVPATDTPALDLAADTIPAAETARMTEAATEMETASMREVLPAAEIPPATETTPATATTPDTETAPSAENAVAEEAAAAEETPLAKQPPPTHIHESEEDEDDEEEADTFGSPFLKNALVSPGSYTPATSNDKQVLLEVVKTLDSGVVDVHFLHEKEKYFIKNEHGRFCLAENKNSKNCYFYFSDGLNGKVNSKKSTAEKTSKLQIPEKLFHKRKDIYRDLIPDNGEVVIKDGPFEYLLRRVVQSQSPKVKLPVQTEKNYHKFLIKSSIAHLFFLIFLGFFNSLPDTEPPPPETHFVQLNTDQFSELKKKMAPPVQKPKPKIAKVTPRPEKKPPAIKPTKKTKRVASTKSARKRTVSKHPKAGGGYGKGNVLNRNIKQTGLLSMLGDSVGIKPQTAMAAVTNLDAVTSSSASEGNFKVGGIVGKLGSAKIEVPKSGVVSTKGSLQVLRSAGASGKGRVAALKKGKTGQKQVMGMVTARLNKTVHIRGGMSREAVKRVIDQHLDEISFCYETALIANPSIMGKVVFEWKILTSGRVGEVNIKSSSINSTEIHTCIKAAIKTWMFPEPKGSQVVVSYPFIFDIVGF